MAALYTVPMRAVRLNRRSPVALKARLRPDYYLCDGDDYPALLARKTACHPVSSAVCQAQLASVGLRLSQDTAHAPPSPVLLGRGLRN